MEDGLFGKFEFRSELLNGYLKSLEGSCLGVMVGRFGGMLVGGVGLDDVGIGIGGGPDVVGGGFC